MVSLWVKEQWKESRASYLESINISEDEILKKNGKECFIFDGTRVFVPNYLTGPTKFANYLRENNIN